MANPILITKGKVDTSTPGKVIIKDNALANNLIQNQEETLQLLSQKIAPLNLKNVSINEQGHILINDKEFEKNIKSVMHGIQAADNGACGAGC